MYLGDPDFPLSLKAVLVNHLSSLCNNTDESWKYNDK